MTDMAQQIDKFDYYIYVPEVGIVYLSGSAFKFMDVKSTELDEKFITFKANMRLMLGNSFKGVLTTGEDTK